MASDVCSCGKPFPEDGGAVGVCECCSGCAPEKVLRITCTDLLTGQSETTEIPAGEYVLLTTAPCHVASTQAYPAKGTHVITIKGRTAP